MDIQAGNGEEDGIDMALYKGGEGGREVGGDGVGDEGGDGVGDEGDDEDGA